MESRITRKEFLIGMRNLGLSTVALNALTGCTQTEIAMGATEEALTRGQWTCLLAYEFGMTTHQSDSPYFTDISSVTYCYDLFQSAYEWEVIEPYDITGAFYPDSLANLEFAILTATKAIGLDRLSKSTNGATLTTNEEIVDYFLKNISAITNPIDGKLYVSDAATILKEAPKLSTSIEYEDVYNVQTTEDTIAVTIDQIRVFADGQTLEVVGQIDGISEGKILLLEPSSKYPEGICAKITSISENGKTLKYVVPEIEDVFSTFEISGTNSMSVLAVVPSADGVTIHDAQATTISTRQSDGSFIDRLGYSTLKNNSNMNVIPLSSGDLGTINWELDLEKFFGPSYNGIVVKGSIKNIKISYDFNLFSFSPSAEISFSSTETLDLAIVRKLDSAFNELTINVFTAYYGIGIASMPLEVKLKSKMEGELSIGVEVYTGLQTRYKKGNISTVLDVDPSISAKISGEISSLVVPSLSLKTMGKTVLDAAIEAGLKAEVETNRHMCIDIASYLYVGLKICDKDKKSVLNDWGIEYKKTFFGKDNSLWEGEFHYEPGNGFVDECTFEEDEKEEDEKDKDLLEAIFPDRIIRSELTNLFDFLQDKIKGEQETSGFEELEGIIELSCMTAVLMENETDRILIKSLPDGYQENDLTWTSNNTSVFTSSNTGELLGISEGNGLLIVSTADGKFTASCAINVWKSYQTTFNPLSNNEEQLEDNIVYSL